VGGSGKQSLAKFAAFVADCDLRTVSMAAGYNLARFREEVKHVLKVSGAVVGCVIFASFLHNGAGGLI
jgi:dynein heavy chain